MNTFDALFPIPAGGRNADDMGMPPAPARCPCCKCEDPAWERQDLLNGKRALKPGPGVEYHCVMAYYDLQ